MVFSSLEFLFVFLPTVLLIYALVYALFKKVARNESVFLTALNLVLLSASLHFYIRGEKRFYWVMLLVGTLDYFFARTIDRLDKTDRRSQQARKLLLALSVLSNMGLLFYFKYVAFVLESLNQLFGDGNFFRVVSITLPIGISFYTFESMSYIIDVYKRETRATRRLIDYWTFITFFPHLVAGPIIRYVDLKAQLEKRTHSLENVILGFRRFCLGLAKKVLIANPMGYHADLLFSLDPSKMDSLGAWMAAIAYSLQIYFDFSGYSDMAIGLGKMFSISLPENFNYPYIATSIQDFWRRWHMTLSAWFRDYMYIPLGGSRKGTFFEYRNLLAVFIFCGLWHGANFTFMFWGLFHGAFLIGERLWKLWIPETLRLKFPAMASHVYTLVVIAFAWVLFRADTDSQALSIWSRMAFREGLLFSEESLKMFLLPHFFFYLFLGIMFSAPLARKLIGENLEFSADIKKNLRLDFVCMILFLISVSFLCGQEYNPFIYFRF